MKTWSRILVSWVDSEAIGHTPLLVEPLSGRVHSPRYSIVTLRPSAGPVQSLSEYCHPTAESLRRTYVQQSNHWHRRRLLRPRRERPCRRAAKEGDEVAPSKANAHLVLPCREAQWIAPYEVFPRALGVDRSSGREVVGTACSLIMSDSSVIMVLTHRSLQYSGTERRSTHIYISFVVWTAETVPHGCKISWFQNR
jgi:hypothetical protein